MGKCGLRACVACLLLSSTLAFLGCAGRKPSKADVETYLKARDLYFRGSIEDAASVIAQVSGRRGGFHQARLLEGKIEYFRKDAPGAQRIFRELASRRPGYTEAELWLIRSLQADGKAKEAEKVLDAALELNPGDPRFLYLAGLIKMEGNDIDAGLSFFKRAEEYAEEFSKVYLESARIYYRFGFTDAALADIRRAEALLPADSSLEKPVRDLASRVKEDRKK